MTDTVSQRPTRHRRVVMLMIFVCVAITFLDRGNISLQFKLTGLNRTVSPDTYSSSLIFTVQ